MAYEQMTLTERAEAHILASRQMLGAAIQNLPLNSPVAPVRDIGAFVALAHAYFAGAQAEATLANACALLASQTGMTLAALEETANA